MRGLDKVRVAVSWVSLAFALPPVTAWATAPSLAEAENAPRAAAFPAPQSAPLSGAPEIPVQQATPTPAADEPARAVSLGVDVADRMTLPVHVGGSGPYPFIIDTGSHRTILSTELARQLALTSRGPVSIVAMSGRATVDTVQVPHLSFGTEEVYGVDALTLERANLGSVGLIGLDGLQDKKVTLDFRARELRVTDSAGPERSREVGDLIVVRARSRLGQLILVDSRVEGQRVSVILDTGAQVSVGNMALFAKMKASRLVIPPSPVELTSVTGETIVAQYSVVKRITVGSVTLSNVPMVFVDAAPFIELGLGKRPAMLLGMEMLRMFDRIAIDFGRREVNFVIPRSEGALGRGRLASR